MSANSSQQLREILRYMGHNGAVTEQLETLISSCIEKIKTESSPRYAAMPLECTVEKDCVTIDTLNINSSALALCLQNCTQIYIFAATLGSAIDRLISQRTKIDSAEALCLQACAAANIEEYCDHIESELSRNICEDGLYLRRRFSPGYGDFDIAHQTDLLNILQAYKRIGVTETKSHMLTPLKSVTAVIGVTSQKAGSSETGANKCDGCEKKDCNMREL